MNKVTFPVLLSFMLVSGSIFAQHEVITTYAGCDIAGYTGDWGSATAARISNPVSIALDKWGNLFIAEQGNNIVRKVSPTGVISTAAGNGSIGYSGDGAAAIAAKLSAPAAVVADTFGNIFIADMGNCVIREVTAGGIISTYAGNDTGGCGYAGDGGTATAAKFRAPAGLAIDAGGNLFVADQGNQVIRRINTFGIITTIAGNDSEGYSGDNGSATAAEMDMPYHLATDIQGNVYFADANNGRVRKINLAGIITTVAGSGITGSFSDGIPATDARLVTPVGIAFDPSGNLLISDLGINQVKKVTPTGYISTLAGSGVQGYGGDNGPATACKFNRQFGLATDKQGNLFIADRDNNVVRKVSIPGSGVNTISSQQATLSLFPNPNNGEFTVSGHLNSIPGENISIDITDMLGRVVFRKNVPGSFNEMNMRIQPMPGLPDGTYFIRLRSATTNEILRFTVNR